MMLKYYDTYYTATRVDMYAHKSSNFYNNEIAYTRVLNGESYHSVCGDPIYSAIELSHKNKFRYYKITTYPAPFSFILKHSNNDDVRRIRTRLSRQLWNAQQCIFNSDICYAIIKRVVLML